MKSFFSTWFGILAVLVVLILAIPALPFILLYLMIQYPIELIRYRKTAYYRQFRHPFEWGIRKEAEVQLYQRVATEQLSAEFVYDKNGSYLIKEGELLFLASGWSEKVLEKRESGWFFVTDDPAENTYLPVQAVIDGKLLSVHPEHQGMQARLLVFLSDLEDMEPAQECPLFYCAKSVQSFL